MSEDMRENNSPNGTVTGEQTGHEESFATLFAKSGGLSERLAPGQKVRAKVVSISGDLVYIDLGGKSEGTIALSEFIDEAGKVGVQEGDEIDAFFVTVQDGIRKMTTLVRGYSPATIGAVRDAFEAGMPVNGEVKREVKGGFEISVGGVRCFCPFSQIDLKGGREGGVYLGLTFPFKVLEYGEEGRNVIVSRRVLLEEEKKARIEELKKTISVGAEIAAKVRSVQNFGAFVDIGGIEGLIPASEISWDRSGRPAELLSPGQEVTVKVISLDWDNNRLTLSLKAMQPDPWASLEDKYPVDGRVSGTIVRLAPFGAFVRLEPGIDGLIHISNLGAGRRINHPKEVVETGQTVEVYVLSLDRENRKLSLSMQPKPKPIKIDLPAVGELIEGVVEKVMPYGIFLKIKEGLTGLIPNVEAGTQPGADHKRMFTPGMGLKAVVIEVDNANNKVRLSRKAVLEKETRQEYQEYVDSAKQAEGTSGGLGSLGDLLRAKMEEKKIAGQP